MRRRLARRYLRGEGLEVGALHQPLALRRGVRVRYVDRHSVDQLRLHYPELRDQELVPVDVIDDGETLATVPDASVDFVVANHFLEHTQDPIGTLGHHLRRAAARRDPVPRPARQAPHVRRPPAGDAIEHLVRDHAEGPAWSRRGHFEEWAALVEGVAPDAVAERARELESYDYSIHFHVWTPTAFTAFSAMPRPRSGCRWPSRRSERPVRVRGRPAQGRPRGPSRCAPCPAAWPSRPRTRRSRSRRGRSARAGSTRATGSRRRRRRAVP